MVAAVRTITRYLAREIFKMTAFAFIAFVTLYAFFDVINELGYVGTGGYRLPQAFLFVGLSLPGHVYELFPIAVLVGTLAALSTLAANSEYTVMRASGFSPAQAGGTLVRVGLVLVLLVLVFGEVVAPQAERTAQRLRLERLGAPVASELRTGLWVKSDTQFVNIGEVLPNSTLKGIRIFDFDRDFRLLSISRAETGSYAGENTWRLADVVETRFRESGATVRKIESVDWASVLTPEMLSVLLVAPEKLSLWELYDYTQHLTANKQRSDRYEIALWNKLLYPFTVLVMMALALPFAYLHIRTGGVGLKLFFGLMLGVLFNFLNNLFSHVAVLEQWTPLAAAALPSAIFLATAVAMMWWVERR
jgi:lipopolysaccharide export system permease protein